MLQRYSGSIFQAQAKKVTAAAIAALFALAGTVPLLITGIANADQLTSRKVTISNSEVSATGVSWTYNFTLPTTTPVQSMRFEFCDTPLGTCTKPAGLNINYTLTETAASSGAGFSVNTDFADYTGADAGACDDHNNATAANSTEFCVTRTAAGNETAASKSFTITNATNASATGTVYTRVSLYSDTGFATEVHNGTVAAAMARQLTVTGRVQERLDFCVAAVDDDAGADTQVNGITNVAGCAAIADTSVDIGIIENTAMQLAPVDNSPSEQGSDQLGVAMINTNASGGTALTYFVDPVVATVNAAAGESHELRSFRVNGATIDCQAAPNFTDQCFQSAPADGLTTITPALAQEYFGMYVPCVDTDEGTVATPLTVPVAYRGNDQDTTNADDCENEDKDDVDASGSQNLAWNDTTSAVTVASTTGVVDDAIVKMSFGAIAGATTPTGSYTVVTTYIATPTF